MADAPVNLPVTSMPMVMPRTLLVSDAWNTFFRQIWSRVRNLGTVSGWANPSGTGSRATFDMDWTTTVSNPPTQAEMTAMRDQLIAVQKRLGQLVIDGRNTGTIG